MITQRLARLLHQQDQPILWSYLILVACACVVQGITFALVVPVIKALVMNRADVALYWLPWLILGTIASWVMGYVSTLSGFRVAIKLLQTLRHRVGEHLVTLPLGWFTPDRINQLNRLLSQGAMELLGLPAHQLTPLMRSVLTPLVLISVLAFIDWRMALAATLVFPALALTYWWAGRLGQSADAATHKAAAEASGRIVEFAQTQTVLRAHSGGKRAFTLLEEALRSHSRSMRRQLWLVLPPLLTNSWLAQLSFLLLMASAVWLTQGRGQPEEIAGLVAILILIQRIVDPLTEIAAYGAGIRMAAAQIGGFEAVLQAQPLPRPASFRLKPTRNDVRLECVSFAYPDGSPVLNEVDLTLPENTTTVLLGASGSGKSSLLHLIARFNDPTDGTVRIGGVDIRELNPVDHVGLIAPVFQASYLFAGSIRDNVVFGRTDVGARELEQAATTAQLDQFVSRLPSGWSTHVGERGMALSGGERQRLALTRALLKDAPILLLDEATSALDPETRIALDGALLEMQGRRTILAVTHRLENLRTADRIVVLDRGHIVEQGSHGQLMAQAGRYAAFWRSRQACEGWQLRPYRRLDVNGDRTGRQRGDRDNANDQSSRGDER